MKKYNVRITCPASLKLEEKLDFENYRKLHVNIAIIKMGEEQIETNQDSLSELKLTSKDIFKIIEQYEPSIKLTLYDDEAEKTIKDDEVSFEELKNSLDSLKDENIELEIQ